MYTETGLVFDYISKWVSFYFETPYYHIICAEVGSDGFGIIYQTSSVVKYFIYFSIAFMKYSQSSAFIDSPKWRLSF